MSEALVPRKHVFDFNQALMDFGATVCVARQPKCGACPMTQAVPSFPHVSAAEYRLSDLSTDICRWLSFHVYGRRG